MTHHLPLALAAQPTLKPSTALQPALPASSPMSAVEINTLEAALLVFYATADVGLIPKARAAAEKYVGKERAVFNGLL